MLFHISCLGVLMISLSLLLQGCNDSDQSFLPIEVALPTRMINGFQVPLFPSPEEQLTFTHSSFSSLDEKKAALEAVAAFFPDAAEQRGEAALDLAYLQMGSDYRQATVEQYRNAMAGYENIIEVYHQIPAICAKAYWYMGWISCNLLNDPGRGIEFFRVIVDRYPGAEMKTALNIPLVSISESQDMTDHLSGKEKKKYWSELSLLETVRCALDAQTARDAFLRLRAGDPGGRLTGNALRILLQRQVISPEAVRFAHEYLELKTDHPFIEADIRELVSQSRLPSISAKGEAFH